MKYPIDSIVSVEVPVTNASQRQIKFPESQLLRSKKVAIVLPSNGYFNPSGKPNYRQEADPVSGALSAAGCYLVLKSGNNEIINRMYIPTMYTLQYSDYDLLYIGKEIDLQKCYIEVASDVSLNPANSFYFQFLVINAEPKSKPILPRRVEYVELPFVSVDERKLYFPDDIKLRGLKLVSLMCPNSGLSTDSSVTPTGNPVFPVVDSVGNEQPLFITLFDQQGKTIFDRVPINLFVPNVLISGYVYLNRIDINFAISYLEYVKPDAANVGKYFLFNVVHEKK